MKSNFETCLAWVLVHEGGYVNHPKDPGGATNRGVIQRTYSAWLRTQGLADRSVKHITDDEVRAIYKQNYWDKVAGDNLPSGVDYAVFDFAVNSGVSRASRYLQGVLGVTADGIIGSNTLAAVDQHGKPAQLIAELCAKRMAFLRRLSHWKTFGRGWTRRVEGEQEGVQERDTGVVDRATLLSRSVHNIPAPIAREDGAGAKAEGQPSVVSTILDAARDKVALGQGGAVIGSVGALSQLEGPLAYAVAGCLVIATLALSVALIRRLGAVT